MATRRKTRDATPDTHEDQPIIIDDGGGGRGITKGSATVAYETVIGSKKSLDGLDGDQGRHEKQGHGIMQVYVKIDGRPVGPFTGIQQVIYTCEKNAPGGKKWHVNVREKQRSVVVKIPHKARKMTPAGGFAYVLDSSGRGTSIILIESDDNIAFAEASNSSIHVEIFFRHVT